MIEAKQSKFMMNWLSFKNLKFVFTFLSTNSQICPAFILAVETENLSKLLQIFQREVILAAQESEDEMDFYQ